MISDFILDGRLEHPQKASFPIFVTLSGILILVRDLHPSYLEVTDYQLFVVNTEEKRIGVYV